MSQRDLENMYNAICLFEEGGKSPLSRKLLVTIGFAGFLTAGMVAPGLLKGVSRFTSSRNSYSRKQVTSALAYLRKTGLVEIGKKKDGSKKIFLTDLGRTQLQGHFVDTIHIKESLVWDRKWRVVIFDIPIEKNAVRIRFRNVLKKWGFVQIQKSVWVIPHKCEDEVFFLSKALHIEEYVDILVVKKFYDDSKFKEIFFKKK